MEYKTLLVEKKEGKVVLVTLNRPERLNALSAELRDELDDLVEKLESDDEVNVMVLTGAPRPDGRPCFSPGGDIKEMQGVGTTTQAARLGNPEEGLIKNLWASGEQRDFYQLGFNRVQAFTKPLIAAIDGICTAGGLELALACDLMVAAKTARFSDLHMKNLKILGGGGMQTRLERAVGVMKAKELAWTGEWIDAEEAYRIGLLCRLFPSEDLIEGALSMARNIATSPPLALKISKMVYNSGGSQNTYESLRFSAFCEALHRFLSAEEMAKAVTAFTEK